MDRLTYPRKFLLISVLFGIPLALATYFLFGEINDSLEITRRQVVGLRYLEASQPLFRRIQEHNGRGNFAAPRRGRRGETTAAAGGYHRSVRRPRAGAARAGADPEQRAALRHRQEQRRDPHVRARAPGRRARDPHGGSEARTGPRAR